MTTLQKIGHFLEAPALPNRFAKLSIFSSTYKRQIRYGIILVLTFAITLLVAPPTAPAANQDFGAPAANSNLTAADRQQQAAKLHASLLALTCTRNLTTRDLRGAVIGPGVYCINRDFRHQGALTLDARNDPSALFVIRIHGRYLADPRSKIQLINGADPNRVFLVSTDTITVSANSLSAGTLLAANEVFIGTQTLHIGSAFAVNGLVHNHSLLNE